VKRFKTRTEKQHLSLSNIKMIIRDGWRQRWLGSIKEPTSLKLQQNRWLDTNNTNPHWSFAEFMCSYFDDLLADNDYQYYIANKLVSKEEYEIIKSWHNELNGYKSPNGEDYDHLTILGDENWLRILNIGLVAKQKLIDILPPEDKEILKENNNVA
jgi:hypothetical protein